MKHVAVFSGGLDSTVTLSKMLSEAHPDDELQAVAFNYGQRHARELEAANRIAQSLSVPLSVIDVRGILNGSSLLGEGEIPDGHYSEETMKRTVVHARNMLFASIAVSRAGEGGQVWLGVHGGDHHIYPDCRPSFWNPYREAVDSAYSVDIQLPYLLADKAQIVREGALLGAPMHLTWSCYKGGEIHCGQCATCLERRTAFELSEFPDPTRYLETA